MDVVRQISVYEDEIIVGGWGTGLFYSNDGGRTWEKRDSGLHHAHMSTAYDGNRMYVGTQGGIYKSNDKGKSWRFISQSFPKWYYTTELVIHNSPLLASTINGNGVYYSYDSGTTWYSDMGRADVQSVIIKGNYAYAAFDGVHKRKLSSFSNVKITKKPLFTLYPNPSENELNISLTSSNISPLFYSIMDVHGRIVVESDLDESDPTLNIGSLKSGFYFLQVRSRNEYSVVRFVKQ